jgi:acyl-CoA synthetase (AMP-forming)/AMP-acid ligase II
MILWNYIRRKMMETPSQTICEGSAEMTFEEMCVFAENYAKKLTAPYYGILCKSEMAAAMALLSCIAAGKPAILMPSRYGAEVYNKIIDRSAPPCILSDSDNGLTTIVLDIQTKPKKLHSSTAVVLFTSGSTGTPKGILLSQKNLLSNIKDISSYFPINKNDSILISRPIYHSSVLTGELLVSLCNGAKIVFSSEAFQPQNILNLMREQKISVFGCTPTLLSTFSRFIRKSNDLSIRLLSISGECMTEGMARTIRKAFPNAKIYCGYGLSEASPRVAYLPPELFDSIPTAAGVPLPSVNLKIINDSGHITTPSEIGELLVNGPNVMLGYFDDRARTKATLREGWLHTGDLACFDSEGQLHIKGRKDDMIIRAGMNIYPAEIESVLSTDARVESILVYGYQENDTQLIGMTISGSFSSTDEVLALCRNKLPPYQIPSKITISKKPDFLASGKKKRKKY